MPLVLRSPYRKITLAKRLGEIGQARRFSSICRQWCLLVAAMLAWATLCVGLDAWLHVPAVGRAAMLCAGLALLAWQVVLLGRARRLPTSAQAVASLIEARYPKLNDALASAVDFQSREDATGSERFRHVAVLRAENLTKNIDLEAVLPLGRGWAGFRWLLLATIATFTLAVIYPAFATLGLIRLLDPFGRHPWPTKTQLTLLEPEGSELLLAKGDPLRLRFRVTGELPNVATIELNLKDSAEFRDIVSLEATEDNPRSIETEYSFDAGQIPRDFSFRVLAGDAKTDWFTVSVAAPPRLITLNDRPSPQISLTFPEYTDLAPLSLPDGSGAVEALSGTVIHFHAACDRPIVSAVFVPQFDLVPIAMQLSASPYSTTNPLGALAAAELAKNAITPIPLRISGAGGNELIGSFTPHLPGLYQLQFVDDRGLVGRRLFDFRYAADPTPVLYLDRPLLGKDPTLLLPTANIPVTVRAEDRPFAVRSLHVEYRFGGPGNDWQRKTLSDLAQWPAQLGPLGGGVATILRIKPATFEWEASLPLQAFLKPNGTPPSDGDLLSLRAAGFDWDNHTAMKAPGVSKEIDLRIAAKPSLEAEIQKDLAALRPELRRLEELQRQAEAKTKELVQKAEKAKLEPEDLRKLNEAEREQSEVRSRISDAAEGVRTKVDQLRRTARAANLNRSPTSEKLETTANELNKLADQSLDAAEAALATAKQEVETAQAKGETPDPNATAQQLAKANEPQQSAKQSFAKILEKLEQWAGAGEIRGEATTVQEQLKQNAERAAKQAEKNPVGKTGEELSPAERAEVAAMADQLERSADRFSEVLSKTARLAMQKSSEAKVKQSEAEELRQASQAARDTGDTPLAERLEAEANKAEAEAKQAAKEAEALNRAIEQAEGDQLAADLKNAAELTRQQRTGDAEQARQAAMQRLQDFREALLEQPEPQADELTKKRRSETTEQVNQLAEQQDELRKKTKQAEAIPAGEDRQKAFEQLAQQQERLRRKAEDLAQRLTRQTEPEAEANAEMLRRATEQMDAAREQLEQGKPATKQQEAALDELDEALERLDRQQQQEREQLEREEREQIADLLKQIRAKQAAARTEAERLDEAANQAQGWSRPLQRSLRDLAESELELAEELTRFRQDQLTRYPVFEKLAEQAATAMKQAHQRIEDRCDDILNLDPDSFFDEVAEAASAKRIRYSIDTALRKLDLILDAMKDDPKSNQKTKPKPNENDQNNGETPDQPGDMPPANQARGGNGLPPAAQLKALRTMQAEVNERTNAFAQAHPPGSKLSDDDLAELRELEQAQHDVAELFEKLAEELRSTGGVNE